MALILAFGVFFMVSCGGDVKEPNEDLKTEVSRKALNEITIDTANTKLEYYIGEKFDSSGLKVNASFNDSTNEDVSSSVEINSSYFDSNTIGEYMIVVSYSFEGRTRTTSYSVKVKTILDNIDYPYIVGLQVEKTKVEYKVNEELTTYDLTVKAIFSDDSVEVLAKEDYQIDTNSVNMKRQNIYPLIIKCSKKYTFNSVEEIVEVKSFVLLTVNDKLTAIEFVDGTLEFEFGSIFSADDWVIKAKYESGNEDNITKQHFTVGTIDTFKQGEKSVKIYYTEMKSTKFVTVKVTVKPNPQAGYTIDKSIVAANLGTDTGADINSSSRKQDVLPDELDSFFEITGTLVKYLDKTLKNVRSVELKPGVGITFTVTGITKLSILASSNKGGATSLLSVVDGSGSLLTPMTANLALTSDGYVSIKDSSGSETLVEYALQPGTYTVSFVKGLDDSKNLENIATTERTGRIVSLTLKA